MSRRTKRFFLLVVVPAVALLAAAGVWLRGGRYVETENAYVKADKVPVSAEVAGAIAEVRVAENQTVAAGQVLFRIDRAPFEVAVQRAQARLAQAGTELAALKASYHEKQAEIALARTRLAFAQRDEQRQTELAAKRFIAPARLDEARQASELARQQITALEQDLKRIAASLGGGPDTPLEQHPSYRAAAAELARAKLDLERTMVRAPLAGTVSKPPKPGQYVAAGQTAIALVATGHVWVEANFTETDLTHVRPGQPVEVHIDTYPDAVWTGVVESLSPATGAEFAVIPPQNATGNWVKITQRLPLRIRLDEKPGLPQLRAGLSATVDIDTGHRRKVLGLSL